MHWLYLAAVVLALVSCRKQDVRTLMLHIPDMQNDACEKVVVGRLKGVAGVKPETIRVDRPTRTVTVAYESLFLSRKNIEFAIAEVGFSANGVPADAEARAKLPPECGL
jgi:copper chaperone CopZ